MGGVETRIRAKLRRETHKMQEERQTEHDDIVQCCANAADCEYFAHPDGCSIRDCTTDEYSDYHRRKQLNDREV